MTQAYTEAALIKDDECSSRQAKELVANALGVEADEVLQKIDYVIQGVRLADKGELVLRKQAPNFISIGDNCIARSEDIRVVTVKDGDAPHTLLVQVHFRDGESCSVEMLCDPIEAKNELETKWLAGLKDVLNGNVN